jgi:hypothetical protein
MNKTSRKIIIAAIGLFVLALIIYTVAIRIRAKSIGKSSSFVMEKTGISEEEAQNVAKSIAICPQTAIVNKIVSVEDAGGTGDTKLYYISTEMDGYNFMLTVKNGHIFTLRTINNRVKPVIINGNATYEIEEVGENLLPHTRMMSPWGWIFTILLVEIIVCLLLTNLLL